MKELSIEEKAQRYDEALKVLHKYDGANIMFSQDLKEEMFPELKESEDEKIRKDIVFYIAAHHKDDGEKARWLYWLEKQVEYAKFRDSIQVGDKVTRNKDGVLVNLSQLKRVAKPAEKEGEQKPTDEVKPKFKVGDWVTNGIDFTFQVRSIEDDMYLRSDDYFIDIETADKTFRLWTIQDAKDGDVLATDDCNICVFDGTVEDGKYPFAYYGLIRCKFGSYDRKLPFTHDSIHPATKEQRDLLFRKMKEAGYEWDAENKQLKKIEQKPAENKGMNLVEEDMTPFQKKVFCIIDTTIEEEQGLKQVCDELLRLAHDESMQKHAWSEEDEKKLNYLIALLQNSTMTNAALSATNERIEDFLKSLKNRVLPQNIAYYNPYKEVVKSIAEMCKHYDKTSHSSLRDFYDNVKVKCKDAKEYASLFPQNTWKPSDKQMEALKEACDEHWEPDGLDPLYTLWKQLKKLREE